MYVVVEFIPFYFELFSFKITFESAEHRKENVIRYRIRLTLSQI